MEGVVSRSGVNEDFPEVTSVSIGRMVNFTDHVTRNFSAQPLNNGKLTESPSENVFSKISPPSSSLTSSSASSGGGGGGGGGSTSTSDTFTIPITITIISITLYVSYYLWRRHRHRALSALSKLEEYRYSRLSQNEVDVDNDRFNDNLCPQNDCAAAASELECDDTGLKPATLQLETDSLITIHDEMSNIPMKTGASSLPSCNGGGGVAGGSPVLIEDLSDEDLLQ